jgi:hypothetical protein
MSVMGSGTCLEHNDNAVDPHQLAQQLMIRLNDLRDITMNCSSKKCRIVDESAALAALIQKTASSQRQWQCLWAAR